MFSNEIGLYDPHFVGHFPGFGIIVIKALHKDVGRQPFSKDSMYIYNKGVVNF